MKGSRMRNLWFLGSHMVTNGMVQQLYFVGFIGFRRMQIFIPWITWYPSLGKYCVYSSPSCMGSPWNSTAIKSNNISRILMKFAISAFSHGSYWYQGHYGNSQENGERLRGESRDWPHRWEFLDSCWEMGWIKRTSVEPKQGCGYSTIKGWVDWWEPPLVPWTLRSSE